MGAVIRLFQQEPPKVNGDTVALLQRLLVQAQAGEITGIAYVALHQGGSAEFQISGSCSALPWDTRRVLARLDSHLALKTTR